MTTFRFDPFRGFEKMTRRMQDFVNEFEKGVNFEIGGFVPRVDIIEDEKNVFVLAEMPGVAKEDVKVSVNEERLLTIKGEKKRNTDSAEKTMIRTERTFGNFTRTFVLPEYLEIDNIGAKFENGILELTLNKIEPPKPKEVDIQIG
jgi:HSP20 family protein